MKIKKMQNLNLTDNEDRSELEAIYRNYYLTYYEYNMYAAVIIILFLIIIFILSLLCCLFC